MTADAAARPPMQAGAEPAMRRLMSAEGMLSGALSKLFALAEAYPDLKANQNMMQLSEELTGTENKIAFSRQAFNDSVMTYNTATQQFPSNVIAGMFSFTHAELLQATESADERKAVKVQFFVRPKARTCLRPIELNRSGGKATSSV
ncbi:MAG: LemA family protein [Burkholderiaceae bacterium]|nr:LemA family protein [Burkholderiaceae bacterium]